MFDVNEVREDFPILDQEVFGHPLVYLDNAATTQVPDCVLQTMVDHYHTANANVHRGIHRLSELSTKAYEEARGKVARFIGASDDACVVFTRGATDGLNMAAHGLEHLIGPGDVVVSTMLEHHSNFVPWQQLALRTGARFVAIGLDDRGDLDLGELASVLDGGNVKIVAATCCSNVLGTVTPVEEIVRMAHGHGALCMLDAAQAMRHRVLDVAELGCDALAFSGHKMCGPTGIGVLYVSPALQDELRPSAFGGEMVDEVTVEGTTFEEPPLCYEAGTPNYVGAIMLGRAVDYLEALGREDVAAYEDGLVSHAVEALRGIEGLRILGDPAHRSGCVSFAVEGVQPFDLCAMVDKLGVALRSGNNCAQPLLRDVCKTPYISRLSVAFYNTHDEIDAAVAAIEKVLPLVQRG